MPDVARGGRGNEKFKGNGEPRYPGSDGKSGIHKDWVAEVTRRGREILKSKGMRYPRYPGGDGES